MHTWASVMRKCAHADVCLVTGRVPRSSVSDRARLTQLLFFFLSSKRFPPGLSRTFLSFPYISPWRAIPMAPDMDQMSGPPKKSYGKIQPPRPHPGNFNSRRFWGSKA